MTGPFPGTAGPISLVQVKTKHAQFERAHAEMVNETCERSEYVARMHVLQQPHFRPRTGALQKATQAKTVRLRNGHLVRISNPKPYAAAIDLGARPHVIRARRAQALHFYWARMGLWFTGPRVNHPGNKPYRFLWHATWGAYRFAGHSLRAGMRRVAQRF